MDLRRYLPHHPTHQVHHHHHLVYPKEQHPLPHLIVPNRLQYPLKKNKQREQQNKSNQPQSSAIKKITNHNWIILHLLWPDIYTRHGKYLCFWR